MKHTEMTLTDKKIIITRAQEQTSEAREIFRKNGAEVFDLPSLVIGPPDAVSYTHSPSPRDS